MAVANRKTTLRIAYEEGIRRCPCCNVQLVWRSNPTRPQVNLVSIDHIVPVSHGGVNTHDNYFVMCRKCNEKRGNKCFVEFVTDRGFNEKRAKEIYYAALVATIRGSISKAFFSNNPKNSKSIRHNFYRLIKSLHDINPKEVEEIRKWVPMTTNFKLES